MKLDATRLDVATKNTLSAIVKTALCKHGWQIIEDSMKLSWGTVELDIGLVAERGVATGQGQRRVAISLNSFSDNPTLDNFSVAVGQYLNHQTALSVLAPQLQLYCAISSDTCKKFVQQSFIQAVINQNQVRLAVFDPETEEIDLWLGETPGMMSNIFKDETPAILPNFLPTQPKQG